LHLGAAMVAVKIFFIAYERHCSVAESFEEYCWPF
jgi:hypothetical protein